MPDKIIRQLDVSDTSSPDLHEFAAKYIYSLENGSPVEHSWEDIKALIDAGIELVALDELPTADASTYNQYKGKIVLIPSANPGTQNVKDEYIIQKGTLQDGYYTLPDSYDNLDFITESGQVTIYNAETSFYVDSELKEPVIIKLVNQSGTKGIMIDNGQNGVYYYMNNMWLWAPNISTQPTPYSGDITLYIGNELDGGSEGTIYPVVSGYESELGSVLGISLGYSWEQIGSTAVDLSNYVQKGTYGTQAASGNTGEAGAATITTSSSGSQSAVGTATITYDKATSIDSHTIAAHSHTVNVSKETLTYISGVKATGGTTNVLTGVGANGTVSVVTGITTTTTSVVTSVEVGSTVSVIKTAIKDVTLSSSTTSSTGAVGYIDGITGSAPALGGETTFVKGIINFSGGSLGGTTTFNTDAIKSASLNGDTSFFKNATVVDGVLSFGKGTVGITTAAASTASVTFTGATFGLSKDTVTISGGSYNATTTKYLKATGVAADDKADVVTGVTVGGTTNVINSVSVNGTSTVLTGVKAIGTATVILSNGLTTSSADIMTGATLSTNGATTLSHNINHTSTTVTGSVEVAVSNHKHTVTIANHPHSLGNHTHDITFSKYLQIHINYNII